MTLTPAHMALIRALAEAAAEQGYLTPQPAPHHGDSQDSAEHAHLPADDQAA